MEDRDAFAVWIAESILRARDFEFEAEALASVAETARSSQDLDASLQGETREVRPGDFGLEFLGPLLPLILVGFGRSLWDAYVKRLAEQGGKALADFTIAKGKDLARHMWSDGSMVSLEEAEARLRKAASDAGLDEARTRDLVASLRNPETRRELANNQP